LTAALPKTETTSTSFEEVTGETELTEEQESGSRPAWW